MAEALKIDNILARIDTKNARGKPAIRNRIYRVGIELEGGWTKLPQGVELVHDGSVKGLQAKQKPITQQQIRFDAARNVIVQNHPQPGVQEMLHVGEFPSEILELQKYPLWMSKNYPSHVNHTCGMHVHMSFNKAFHYCRLMVPEYPQTIVIYMAKWAMDEKLPANHPIWDRLRGKNEFCKLEFFPDEQAKQSRKIYDHAMKGHRYTVINYCHAKTSTLECRLLPMMDTAEQGIRAVKRVLDITNACLVALKGKEEKVRAKLVVDNSIEGIDEKKTIYV